MRDELLVAGGVVIAQPAASFLEQIERQHVLPGRCGIGDLGQQPDAGVTTSASPYSLVGSASGGGED